MAITSATAERYSNEETIYAALLKRLSKVIQSLMASSAVRTRFWKGIRNVMFKRKHHAFIHAHTMNTRQKTRHKNIIK